MKSYLRHYTAAAFLLVPVAATLMALPAAAQSTLPMGDRTANQTLIGAAPTTMSLRVTSHPNNAQISTGATVVQGRTLPGAFVDIKVKAIASVVGVFGMTQELTSQRVQADGNGNFSFSFTPQMPLPGSTRYEVTMVSHRGEVEAEATLVLFQHQG